MLLITCQLIINVHETIKECLNLTLYGFVICQAQELHI